MCRITQEIRQEGVAEGRIQGRIEGKIEGKIETARNCLQEGLSHELAARITGLSLTRVQELAKEHAG